MGHHGVPADRRRIPRIILRFNDFIILLRSSNIDFRVCRSVFKG